MKRKAQGLPMQTIIIAVLVLLVLGIMAFFLIKGTGKFTRGVGECTEKGGKCDDLLDKTCQEKDPNYPIYGFKGCYVKESANDVYKENNICCLKIG